MTNFGGWNPDINRLTGEINGWTSYYGIENFAGNTGLDQDKNAFAHAYSSAMMAYDGSSAYSKLLGDLREIKTYLGAKYDDDWNYSKYLDGMRDLYNNAVGVAISDYAKEHNLPRSAIPHMVADAVKNKQTISDERLVDDQINTPASLYTGPSEQLKEKFKDWYGIDVDDNETQSNNWSDPSADGTGETDVASSDHDSDSLDGESDQDSENDTANSITTPVVIDLSLSFGHANQTGDGLSFIGLDISPIMYNSDNDGFLERTAWVGPTEGIVVFTESSDGIDRDLNHDGKITAAEIALTNVVPGATTDMEALWKGFDKGVDADNNGFITLAEGKGDHKITSAEAALYGLRIWQDADMDGVLDAGEMRTFADAGISEIDMTESNLAALAQEGDGLKGNEIVETRFSDGSVIFGTAKVTLTNGNETTAYDMGFAHEAAGIKEFKDSAGYTTEVRIQHQTGGGDWGYLTATGSTAVDWDFDTNGKVAYYGGTGSAGNDKMVYSGSFSRSFAGGAGNDTLTGGQGDDFLIGGAGSDRLSGRGGNDVLYVDAQDLTGGLVDGGEGFDVIKVNSAAGVTVNMTSANAEAFYGSAGNDIVNAGGRMIGVILSGGAGNDLLTGGADSDIIIGGEGNDSLNGGDKHDQLIGGKGVDTLYGGDGDDYIVADEFDNFAHVRGGAGFDILIIDDSGDDTVNFTQQLNLINMGFEAAIGGEGNDVFNVSSIEKDTFLVGMGGNDTLTTGFGNDLLAGGKGNDLLDGGNGSDTYVFNREDGQDVIQETNAPSMAGGLDSLVFGADIRVDDLQFELVNSGKDLVISLRNQDSTTLTGDTMRINNWNVPTAPMNQVEVLAFSDGTILDIGGGRFTTGSASSGLDIIDAGIGNNTIDALDGNDVVLGRAGNDNIHGSRGHDYIDGGLGDDILFGDEDDDSLLGGQGNGSDSLNGGAGDDYLDGEDGGDTLVGGAGKDQLWGGAGWDTLNGGAGDDILAGEGGNDQLDGGLGDDVYFFERKNGHDTIYDEGSDDDFNLVTTGYETNSNGQDIISQPITKKVYHEGGADTRLGDRIAFGFDIKMTDLAFDVTSSGDLRIGISRAGLIPNDLNNLADLITVKNWGNENKRIERLNFMDGAVLYVEGIDGASSGNNSSNVLDGGDNDNLLTGGGNSDTIRGHDGNDIIVGGEGWDDLRGQNGNDVIFGGSGNDNIRGGNGNDRLFGGAGNDDISGNGEDNGQDQGADDYIVGGTGNDILRGGAGNDTYFFSFGDGVDTITEVSGVWPTPENDQRTNTIAFGSGIWFSDLKVTGGYGTVTMEILPLNRPTDEATSITMDKFAIRQLAFANGYFAHFGDIEDGVWGTDAAEVMDQFQHKARSGVWLNGNGGDDVLKGGGGRDVLIGGEENDTLNGKGGSDYYVFNAFDGRDVLWDSGGESDSLAFGPGITLFDLSMKSVDGDLVISIRDPDREDLWPSNAENSVTIKNWSQQTTDAHIEWMDFTIGSSFKIGRIDRALFKGPNQDDVNGNDSSEWIEGGTGGDTIMGNGGHDVIFGRAGFDNLFGGDKDDQLYGEGGNDTLRGNDGNDQLFGGLGSDNLVDNTGSDHLYGGDGDDTLNGGRGSNLLNGGGGNDLIYRGGYLKVTYTPPAFQDGEPVPSFIMADWAPVRKINKDEAVTVVEFARGDGKDTIRVESPNDNELTGIHDHIDMIGVSIEEVWFEKESDNLIVSILGTEDQMIFVDYYKDPKFKFGLINADGQTLERDEVEELRLLMSEYTPSRGKGYTGISASEIPDNILSAMDAKWETADNYA